MREMEKNDLINTTATTEHGFSESKCKDLIKNYKMMFTSVQEKGKCSIKDPIPKTNNHCSSRDRLKPISEQKKGKQALFLVMVLYCLLWIKKEEKGSNYAHVVQWLDIG